ncbi:YidC/Oxa1 family membrane protein insertase [Herbivorax sp. ANBcel31]|uniref:YidC/Oxa1 family membrane protein insertase n=1 Tax=Herbivorax sp. ANBcel31 TaxID=3069754 RepID=UPI0027AE5E87|nr:YidC/Oxa1 family membrane protein insertase [Herbivorax sp. ANBcel31]MDQ2086012.1 YidC/Oxa1 family membrane protein insertase [Herbivorax sp. ANBcel31]
MFSAIPSFFGQILYFIYDAIPFELYKYGLSLIVLTIFIRTLILPLTLKQVKSQAKMQEIQPIIKDIQKKYKNDKEKLSQEMMKVYQEHKYNPASGCLPLLVQMPIIISLFAVIRRPLTYMLKGREFKDVLINGEYKDIILNESTIEKLVDKVPADKLITGHEQVSAALEFGLIDFNFLGLNLGINPTIDTELLFGPEMATYLPLLLIPLLACITTYFSTKMISKRNKSNTNSKKGKKDEKADVAESMQKNMLLIGPAMTLIFSFQFPAGLGFYWIIGNIYQIVQQIFVNKLMINKKEG